MTKKTNFYQKASKTVKEKKKQELLHKIEKLSTEQKMILDMLVIKKMPIFQVARLAEISEQQVYDIYKSAFDMLKINIRILGKKGIMFQ